MAVVADRNIEVIQSECLEHDSLVERSAQKVEPEGTMDSIDPKLVLLVRRAFPGTRTTSLEGHQASLQVSNLVNRVGT